MLSDVTFFSLTNTSFLVSSNLLEGTLLSVLQAVIIIPIRINNDIFAEDSLKGCNIFESKVHFFMVSKNQIKFIKSLHQKKYRLSHGLFIAEGKKVIEELFQSNYALQHLYQTEPIFESIPNTLKTLISADELRKLSALNTANNCLAIFKIPPTGSIAESSLIVALDDIRDPGNLGTILRICDWFGIEQVVCSNATVDLYNPKVIQATMGSVSRVNVYYTNLVSYIKASKLPVYGTFMDGTNVYHEELPKAGIIVFGNEANGISKELSEIIKHRIAIPRFGKLQQTESLNVATATAIILSEFCRNQ